MERSKKGLCRKRAQATSGGEGGGVTSLEEAQGATLFCAVSTYGRPINFACRVFGGMHRGDPPPLAQSPCIDVERGYGSLNRDAGPAPTSPPAMDDADVARTAGLGCLSG